MSCRAQLYARAKTVAERYNMDVKKACQSLTPIGVNGSILIGASGSTFVTAIDDELLAPATPGDHIDFKSLGSQRYLVLGMINLDESATRQTWGYRGFNYNGNDVKNNFEESFEADAPAAGYWNVEAVRSGIEAFPWECLPAFGPNDRVKIGLYNRAPGVQDVNILAYAMPVPDTYKPSVVYNRGG